MQYLKLFENFEALDLSNYDSAYQYALNNISFFRDVIEDYESDSVDINNQSSYDWHLEMIHKYVDKYNEVKNLNSIDIYRIVLLNKIEDLELDRVGIFWSFEADAAGHYGDYTGEYEIPEDPEEYLLTAQVNPKDIDWITGFNSFIFYGEDQWECAMKKGSSCLITHVNDEKLETPLQGIC